MTDDVAVEVIERCALDGGDDLVLLVDVDGSTAVWISRPEHGDDDPGCACPECAPHEQDGPLPRAFKHRLADAFFCSATTAAGHRCRIRVNAADELCAPHRAQQERREARQAVNGRRVR